MTRCPPVCRRHRFTPTLLTPPCHLQVAFSHYIILLVVLPSFLITEQVVVSCSFKIDPGMFNIELNVLIKELEILLYWDFIIREGHLVKAYCGKFSLN